MRYSILSFLACPSCLDPLICLTHEETPAPLPLGLFPDGTRVSPGPGLGPAPEWRVRTSFTSLLDSLAAPDSSPERGREVEVQAGLLICGHCGRWFPIERGIPELLPDHLRDAAREMALARPILDGAPPALREALSMFRPGGNGQIDTGAHYKQAEMSIKDRIDDPGFFGPGYSSPFNPWNATFSIRLIALFGTVVPLLELQQGSVVLDSGCGYAWTTEWLFRSGYDAVGVDICRTYLDIAVARMGAFRPHLVVGDVENLPFQDAAASAVLAFESFHHIPDRSRALKGYDRVLGASGTVLLAEPGSEHEGAAVSVDASAKYGILERGMEHADVVGYVAGTGFNAPEQILVLRSTSAEIGRQLDAPFARCRSVTDANLFRLTKGAPRPLPLPPEPVPPREPSHVERGLQRVRSALGLRPA